MVLLEFEEVLLTREAKYKVINLSEGQKERERGREREYPSHTDIFLITKITR